jgi:predicted PolB exonuclease-like 3'-5' exonuclease
MKTVVLDIETIPNVEAMSRARYVPEPGEFAPWPLHEIVCASVFTVESSAYGQSRFDLRSFSRRETTEAGIVASVERAVEDAQQIVTYNGQAFDLPVLVTRAVVHELHAPTLARLSDRCRPGLHMDVHERIRGSNAGVKLAHLCAAFGIPAKEGGDGRCVAELANAGDWPAIKHYCETDVIATWLLAAMWDSRDLPGLAAARWLELSRWLKLCGTANPRLVGFDRCDLASGASTA